MGLLAVNWTTGTHTTCLAVHAQQLVLLTLCTDASLRRLALFLLHVANCNQTFVSARRFSSLKFAALRLHNTGTVASFSMTVQNTGNVHLKNVTVRLPEAVAKSLQCSSALPGDILAVAAAMHCEGSINFAIGDVEAGGYTVAATAAAENLPQQVAATNLTIAAAPSPQLYVDVLASNCTKPPRARECSYVGHYWYCQQFSQMA